jgi:hypothetical protein
VTSSLRRTPRVESFARWLTGLGDAWEAADSSAFRTLFVVGATFAPDPFAPLIRGRAGIAAWFEERFVAWPRASFVAQVLGAGDTYGVAHFRVATADRALDGVWVVALDARGRCESLREWSSATTQGSAT